MSKVVKGLSRVVGNVVGGVAGALGGDKEKWEERGTKWGKVIVTSAAVYFGAGAAMGAAGGVSTGLGAGQGALAGIKSAWAGIGSGQLLGGAYAAGAGAGTGGAVVGGSTLASSGAVMPGAGAGTAVPAATVNLAVPAGAQGVGASATGYGTGAGLVAPTGTTLGTGTGAGFGLVNAPAAAPGFWGGVAASPYTAPALITAGGQLLGGVVSGIGAQKEADARLEEERLARERYAANVAAPVGNWQQRPVGLINQV